MNHATFDVGAALVFLGSAAGLEPIPVHRLESDQSPSYFGFSVASAGDVDGDGYDDVLVGAPYYEDGEQDEGRAFLFAGGCVDPIDSDLDGVGDVCETCPGTETDADGDGFCVPEDCADDNAAVYPGASEICDGLDTTCSGSVPLNEIDEDGDGEPICAGDCDDTDPGVYSGKPEVCSGRDDNCDGELSPDEVDADGDSLSVCGGDCDDDDDRASPGQLEVCGDSIDNDCDGAVDPSCDSDEGDSGDTGCACDGAGGVGGAPILALTLLLRVVPRRGARAGSSLERGGVPH